LTVAMELTLTSYPGQVWAVPIRVVAGYAGVTLKTAAYEFGTTSEAYRALHPTLKCPVLTTSTGAAVFETPAIAKLIAALRPEAGLLPSSVIDAAQVDAWSTFAATEIQPLAGATLFPYTLPQFFKYDAAAFTAAAEKFNKALAGINAHLLTRTYLVTEKITLADILLAGFIAPFFAVTFGEDIRAKYPNATRWFLTVVNQPAYVAAAGEPKLAAKTTTGPPAKPEPTPAPAPAAAAAATATAAKPSKPKHPLDLLPKSSMPLDELKRQYSNTDTRPEFLPWLYANFDAEGYCIYHCTYKYSNELAKTFMAANLITGWFQRLEHLRKYLFGNVHVFGASGEPGSVGIAGVWIMRGAGIPEEMVADATDGELYEWRKLDLNADKALIEDFCAWDGEFAGGNVFDGKVLPFNQGKTFK